MLIIRGIGLEYGRIIVTFFKDRDRIKIMKIVEKLEIFIIRFFMKVILVMVINCNFFNFMIYDILEIKNDFK